MSLRTAKGPHGALPWITTYTCDRPGCSATQSGERHADNWKYDWPPGWDVFFYDDGWSEAWVYLCAKHRRS